MRDYRDVVRPLSAEVLPDGSIEVELYVPHQEETVSETINATKQSKKLAPDSRREIDIDDDGDPEDALFRFMIEGLCAEAQRQVAARLALDAKRARI
jgi:hypothetical protein